jgi:hypothetical protein
LFGYTLISPMRSTETYLLDMEGRVVRTWTSDCPPALCAYLLENGNLLRPGVAYGQAAFARGPGAGGRVQEFTWDGEMVWDFTFPNEEETPHHDVERLPNGNVLLVVWEKKTRDEAIAAGRNPELLGDGDEALKPDYLVEIKPTGKTTGEIVWEWHVWDHLVQDHDASKANYGDVAAHPELVDINYSESAASAMRNDRNERERPRPVGPGGGGGRTNPDWTHVNAVAYNAEFDQIVLSVHSFSEIWIIDHSTNTEEAAGHTGGRSGKGGDLLYRWGNPRVYRAGTAEEQRLFKQHDAHWIGPGRPGAGHLLVFNNGNRRPAGEFSSVDELELPVDDQGRYSLEPGKPYGPEEPIWSYVAPDGEEFYSMLISGAQRLTNGNTLVCEGLSGRIFEVTPENKMVWEFASPIREEGGPGGPGGRGPGGPSVRFEPPRIGQILPSFLQDVLQLGDEQRKQIGELQTSVDAAINSTLDEAQQQSLEELQREREFPGDFAQPGQVMSVSVQNRLKLSDDQQQKIKTVEADVAAKLREIFDESQEKRFDDMLSFARRGPGGAGGRDLPPIAGGFRPRGPAGRRGGPGASSLFRAYRYRPDFPGLAGKDLTPGKPLEEIAREKEKERPLNEQPPEER